MKLKTDTGSIYSSPESAVDLRTGQIIELKCESQGGNPTPMLSFIKNGEKFGPESTPLENTYKYTVTEDDNKATIGCSAQNSAGKTHNVPQATLNVLCE